MKGNKLYQFVDNRVFIDIGEGCGNACKYCYLSNAAESQIVFNDNTILSNVEEIIGDSQFKSGKTGTIISFCPHTEPFKSRFSAEALLYTIKQFAPYQNLMQLATKEIIPDFFITEVNKLLSDGQLTVFISVSSLEKQGYLEPFASDFHVRFQNVNRLQGSRIKSCIYLKPFLFAETEFEYLTKLIIESRPDAVCIGVVYTHQEIQDADALKHPTENGLLSEGTNEKMIKFYNHISEYTYIPIHFTSTCVIAQLSCIKNDVLIPRQLCVNCDKECVIRKWDK